MATIVSFTLNARRRVLRRTTSTERGTVIIFPGIRYERRDDDQPGKRPRPDDSRASKR